MTDSVPEMNWLQANQRYLTAAAAVVRQALEQHLPDSLHTQETGAAEPSPEQVMREARQAMSAPPALETLCDVLGLSSFERGVLLLCAGVELDSRFAPLCAAAQGDAACHFPTFSLALAALPEAHWSALSTAGPLQQWRLIEVGAAGTLTGSPLRIDERILHYLTGTSGPDERLRGIIEPLFATAGLVGSHAALAERIVAVWSRTAGSSAVPAVQLCGDDVLGKRAVAVAACSALGLGIRRLPAQFIPASPGELDALLRLWGRESALSAAALLVDCDDLDTSDAARAMLVGHWIERAPGLLLLSSREPRHTLGRLTIVLEVPKPATAEQRTLWHRALGAAAGRLNGQVERLAAQFTLSAPSIYAACTAALGEADGGDLGGGDTRLAEQLWDACRVQARPRLDNLAQRIEPAAGWDDLVLPEAQGQTLREIATHVRQRITVYESWGFAAKCSRGLGISALFTGVSGTGKTMAAEVLAGELRLDLYRIDLSQVVSKYIGETEKNLRRVFDAAEEGGAILLFDEADALFGKRSEVKDSHDRYANIEVSYLLQRMEAYRGLAILTTNMKNALDTAFLRRIRFIVQFPFPDAAQRAEIWRRIFPADTPTHKLDHSQLARLNVAGGNIRNIALHAAFLAADMGQPVGMSHLLRAARSEYAKLEKLPADAEIGGWT